MFTILDENGHVQEPLTVHFFLIHCGIAVLSFQFPGIISPSILAFKSLCVFQTFLQKKSPCVSPYFQRLVLHESSLTSIKLHVGLFL